MTDQSFVFTSLYKIAVNTTGDPGEHKLLKKNSCSYYPSSHAVHIDNRIQLISKVKPLRRLQKLIKNKFKKTYREVLFLLFIFTFCVSLTIHT